MKKVAVVSGTRAEYGLLAPIMRRLVNSLTMELQLVVTGSHLLSEFGLTVSEIERDGFMVNHRVPQVSSASSGLDVAHQVGAGTAAFADVFTDLEPDVVLVLGDRYEIFAAASAAFFLNIPVMHLHGGEVTSGAFDDAIRHVISQLSHIHAVAAPEYGERLVRAGAHPDTVHVVGGLGVDVAHHASLSSRDFLEEELNLTLSGVLFLVTYHPVTRAAHDTEAEMKALLEALDSYPDATIVFTLPNADPEHAQIVESLREAVGERANWFLFPSLGSNRYLSLMALASVVVGNSSSGLTEAPSLGTPTVNIGPRQQGRLLAKSVISCGAGSHEITAAIDRALVSDFAIVANNSPSPYGGPGAVDRILQLLEQTSFGTLGEKKYFDPPSDS